MISQFYVILFILEIIVATYDIITFPGARGLRSILENVLMDIMYEIPGSDITQVTITREVVENQTKPHCKRESKPQDLPVSAAVKV